jgi:hypothetical protein
MAKLHFLCNAVLAASAAAVLWDGRTAAKTSIQEVSEANMRIMATATANSIKDQQSQNGEVPASMFNPHF